MTANLNENAFLKKLGSRIKVLRVAQGFSQTQLADSVGMSQRYLSEIEAGKRNISIYFLKILAERLSISLPELLDFNDVQQREDILKDLNIFLQNLSRDQLLFLKRATHLF